MTDTFERVVCGVDDSDAGALAARLAARVTLPDGSLTLVTVETTTVVVHAGLQTAAAVADLSGLAQAALDRGREAAAPKHAVTTRLVKGDPIQCLLAEVEDRQATLAVVGSHGVSRPAGIVLGSVATHLLHSAPCSVLIAHSPRQLERWPRSIVVGIDGSDESGAAARAARKLAERTGASLRQVVATGDDVDVGAALAIAPDVEELPGKAIDELHVLSENADLVVVGSRGLKGLRALGSVSERVAHRARCPVLVVRDPR